MKRLIIASVLFLAPAFGFASGGAVHLEESNIDLADKESLQRGAKSFVNYCMGCHSLQYMRYNRMGEDLGLDDVQVRQNFIFDGETKPGDLMVSAMRPEDGEKWFGTAVPDLTLVTRWRSADWVYSYLKGFYVDEGRPYGVNNAVFPDVGMPHVLAGLQGMQKPVYGEAEGEDLLRPRESWVHATQGKETPNHESRSYQEYQSQGHLTHHQEVPGSIPGPAGGKPTPSLFQSPDEIRPEQAESWKESQSHPGDDGNPQGEEEHSGIQAHLMEAGKIPGSDGLQEIQSGMGQADAQDPS